MRYKRFDRRAGARTLLRIFGPDKPEEQIRFKIVILSVAPSGMSRCMRVYVLHRDKLHWIGEGRIRGCGMDMGYALCEDVYFSAYGSQYGIPNFTNDYL